MKALACLALIGSAGLVFATPNPDDVQKRCTEQERQIAALEKEISALHSQIALERRLARGVDATPAAAGVSAASAGKATETYKVVSGDTLSSIARRYDTSSKALMSENGIEDPTRLRVGQSLKVPAAGEAKTANPGTPLAKKTPPKKTPAGPYTVKTGDTFYKIARNHSLTVAKLEALNPGTDPGRIQIGQRLRVSGTPSSKSAAVAKSTKSAATKGSNTRTISTTPTPPRKSSSAPLAKSAPKPAPKPAPKAEPKTKSISSIIVMDEISFGGFAEKHGTTPKQLNALNGLSLKASTVLAKGSELYVSSR